MKAIKSIGVLLCATILFSCEKNTHVPNNILKFSPCKTTQIWAVPGCMCYVTVKDTSFYGFNELTTINSEGNLEISSKEYLLAISTAELSDSIFHPSTVYIPVYHIRDSSFTGGEHNSFIEEQLATSYRRKEAESTASSGDAINLVEIEYRTDGIRNLKISATCQLWGEAPGNVLNDYFFITKYVPEAIVSSKTDKLLFGFTEEKDMPKNINEWLELEPYTAPSIRVMFNEAPPELPCDVQFIVEMETDEGVILSTISMVVHITQ